MKKQDEKFAFGTSRTRAYHLRMVIFFGCLTIGSVYEAVSFFGLADQFIGGVMSGGGFICAIVFVVATQAEFSKAAKKFDVKAVIEQIDSDHQENETSLEQLNRWKEDIKGDDSIQSWIEMAKQFYSDDQDEIIKTLEKETSDINKEQAVLKERKELLQIEEYETFFLYFRCHVFPWYFVW